ncbi:MAG: hypothetical protein EOO62_20640 [Hymenobacter sp.]|nr:MAG: hypothetical protein EOO62_20640 [Hymenobacter sp.]
MTRFLLALAWPRSAGWLALGAALATAAPGSAQQPVADTCAARPPVPVRAPRLGLSIILDNRNSFVQESAVRIIGLNVGVVPRGKPYRLGVGAYTLRRSYADLYTYSGKGKRQKLKDTLTPALSLTYFTPNFTYTFFHRRFIELSVPVDIGLGRSHYTITDENGNVTTDDRGLFIPAEIGLGVLLKPTRWRKSFSCTTYRSKSLAACGFPRMMLPLATMPRGSKWVFIQARACWSASW